MNNNKYLDAEEKEYIESYENDEWQSVDDLEREKKAHAQYAKNSSIKNKRINIRMTERDLLNLKAESKIQGLPYQSLISSVLHKYINGTLVEKES
ncbi:MAG: antitoxin [candidate division KSB1 bacterium]|nr:antitoxin [candidate division KSB1 bacterium]